MGHDATSTRTQDLKARYYPEVAVGGFSRVDGTVDFFARINAVLHGDMRILDFGPGRGQWAHDDPVEYRRQLRWLRGKVERVVGCDVDRAVRENPSLDDAVLISPEAPLPFADGAFDLILADWVFEHITDPEAVCAELDRVLRPGGWIFARTANRYGYVALASSLVPNALHVSVLRRAQPDRKEQDVFPTAYRMNTRRRIAQLFPDPRYERTVYACSAEPSYAGNSPLLWSLSFTLHKLLPEALQTALHIMLRKAGAARP